MRHDGREIAAGAVAADEEAGGVDAVLFGVGGDPFRGQDRVVDGCREFVLGRKPIVDGDHDQLALMGELAADHVVRFEIADHPAAAVKEHETWSEPVLLAQRLRRVDARRDRAVRGGDGERLGRFQFRRLGITDEPRLQDNSRALPAPSAFHKAGRLASWNAL